MPVLDLKNLTQEERSELSLIDVAHFILEQRKETILFPELVKEIQAFLGLKDAEIRERLVQFYTDMNIDGNFISLGNNTWGLRAWYPMDAIDEEVQTQTTPKKNVNQTMMTMKMKKSWMMTWTTMMKKSWKSLVKKKFLLQMSYLMKTKMTMITCQTESKAT
ncbi:DNA-directed RNA polymerase subunit delta [Listeria monocytogenes]|nr:DNA-directed RNA polymerase subunit delta [Listeria monocytogenes]